MSGLGGVAAPCDRAVIAVTRAVIERDANRHDDDVDRSLRAVLRERADNRQHTMNMCFYARFSPVSVGKKACNHLP
jgi:hypothetical protein